jgi:putative ABC transport system permease protein
MAVSAGYFQTVGIPLLQGREFTALDGADAPPVAVLSDSTAHHLFPNQNPIGRRVKFGDLASAQPWMTIIGVVGETEGSVTSRVAPYQPVMYRPLMQGGTSHLRVFVRTRGPSSAMLVPMRSTISGVVPNAPLIGGMTTMDAVLERQLGPLRINAVVLGAFAALALVVATLGIYGTVAYLVEQRTSEIGVRIALGAQSAEIVLLNMRRAFGMSVAGIVIGIAGSYLVTGLLRSLIYDTSPTDPRVFGGAAVLLATVTFAAAYIPARRTLAIDPARVLRRL